MLLTVIMGYLEFKAVLTTLNWHALVTLLPVIVGFAWVTGLALEGVFEKTLDE